MQMRFLALVGISAMACTGPAYAGSNGFSQSANVAPPTSTSVEEVLPRVVPGDHIAIACGALEQRPVDSDVRVVLTISAAPGESAPGYRKILATDAELLKNSVRVRIPDVPDIEDHTVDLDVYVVSDKGSQRCDAGQMKIS